LAHTDLFSAIGAFSAPAFGEFDVATAYNGAFRDVAAFNKNVRLFWLGAGTAEGPFAARVRAMHEALDKAEVRHAVYESQGTSHEWQTWRRSLHDFAPRLFEAADACGARHQRPYLRAILARNSTSLHPGG
jgi:enterochelin esterase family protein